MNESDPVAARLLMKSLLFITALPGLIVVAMPIVLLSIGEHRTPVPLDVWSIAGGLTTAAGIALYIWCLHNFLAIGRGTPSPLNPPRFLVARGPYRFMRNPMYVAVLAMLAGEALAFQARILAFHVAATAAVLHLFVIAYEEPNLRARFGEAYDEYRRSVPRWLLLR